MIEEFVLLDKSQKPGEEDLERVLGRVKTHWDNLTAHAVKENPDAKPEWRHYTKKAAGPMSCAASVATSSI